jgi:hypothetical protein
MGQNVIPNIWTLGGDVISTFKTIGYMSSKPIPVSFDDIAVE